MKRRWSRLSTAPAIACLVVALPVVVVLLPVILALAWWEDRRTSALRREFHRRWRSERKLGLLVYSNSPHWQGYVEGNWLPRIADRFVVLNWSERATWGTDHALEARLFRHYAGDDEFNPIAVIFNRQRRGATFAAWLSAIARRDAIGFVYPYVRDVQVIRFWRAFRDFKHGKDRALRAAEAELFTAADVDPPSPSL